MSVLRGPISYARAMTISGAVIVLVVGLFVRQTSTTNWIAASDTVKRSVQSSDQPALVGLVTEPKRRPIDPGEWGHVFKQETVAEGSHR
jgi:hypothetical protein